MPVLLFIIQLIQIPAIILGLIAMVGLILQQKSFGEILSGTVKTILGLLILSVGIGALINSLIPIQNMFQAGFSGTGLQTFVTFDEGVVGAVQSANVKNVGAAIAFTLLFGYIIHIILARVTPFKYLYLTGHMIWIHAGAFAILFYSFGLSLFWTVLLASIVDGLYMTLMPALAQPIMRLITGTDDIAFGHGQTLLNMLGAWVGKLIGNKENSAEDLKVPEGLNFFRDVAISISIIMLIVAFIAAIVAVIQIGIPAFEKNISNGQNWLVFTILQALGFTAGVLVLLQGVR
ncbi:MAG TPA: PTS transporter subunit IIC, partial [Anaerolineales bacterium]|nr:PTS transporter subunit IIC [Anaerolineales bacterium]